MDRVIAGLWLGDFEDCRQISGIDESRAVMTLCEAKPPLPPSVLHIHLPIRDEIYLLPDLWGRLIGTLTALMDQGKAPLVHCRLGVSRAPTLVAGYLLTTGQASTPDAALAFLQNCRPCVRPHPATWQGMVAFWQESQHAAS